MLRAATPIQWPVAGRKLAGTWASVAGKKYRVQRSATLVSTDWVDVSPEITASGASSSYNDTGAGTTQRFYRVRLVP